jgi:hypothetical protein
MLIKIEIVIFLLIGILSLKQITLELSGEGKRSENNPCGYGCLLCFH